MAGVSRPSRKGSAASNWMTTTAAGAARAGRSVRPGHSSSTSRVYGGSHGAKE